MGFPQVLFPLESWTPRKLTKITIKGFCCPTVLGNVGLNELKQVISCSSQRFWCESVQSRQERACFLSLVAQGSPSPRFVFQTRPDCWKMEIIFNMFQAVPIFQASVTICFILISSMSLGAGGHTAEGPPSIHRADPTHLGTIVDVGLSCPPKTGMLCIHPSPKHLTKTHSVPRPGEGAGNARRRPALGELPGVTILLQGSWQTSYLVHWGSMSPHHFRITQKVQPSFTFPPERDTIQEILRKGVHWEVWVTNPGVWGGE